MSKLYKNVVVLDSGAGFFALLVAAPAPEVPGAAQFQLMELLQSLAQQGRTVVMVLHDLAHAMQYSDAVGVFADGKLAAFAEPSQLYEQKIWEEVFQVRHWMEHIISSRWKETYCFMLLPPLFQKRGCCKIKMR